jgi:4-azaleucine resistance transporter AzlC
VVTLSARSTILTEPVVRDAIAIGLAVGTFGVSFGALAVAAGLSPAQAIVTSLLVFTGASQFAFIGVLAAGGGLVAATLPAVILAARNGLYGVAVAPLLQGPLLKRLACSHLIIDESTAMARAQAEPEMGRRALIATGLAVLVCWNLGTAIGAASGGVLGDPRRLGLDAMLPAAFLALLSPHLARPEARRAAVAGGLIALVLIPIAPVGLPIIAAGAAVIVPLVAPRRANRPR